MRYTFLLFLGIVITLNCNSQTTRKVLFLGNSYTYVNNLPQLVADIADGQGDSLIFDSHTPGGYQLIDHSIDATSKSKIMSGGWDYVVIQGQSQEPIIFSSQFSSGGIALYNLIKQYNPCAVTIPYMTWGRKNGDASNCASFPLMCTYQGMDTTIRKRYLSFTAFINGEVSPVSVVWNYLRQNHPNIDLYQADESHPSLAGSYAAACCFYATIFKKDPALITYNGGLSATDASAIKNAVKLQVFNSLQLWDFKKLPVSNFSYNIGTGNNQIVLSPINQGVNQTYLWNFGDGSSSTLLNATHSYSNDGTYTLSLTTINCDLQGLHSSFTDTIIQFCSHTPTVYSSNQWLCNYDTLWTQTADSYQWLSYGVYLPETKQYLANYSKYNLSALSVITSLNGCSERSRLFAKTPEWSGYYFDGIGDPCAGDTVAFAVLHTNGFLSGSEKILWFKNGMLLSSMTNEDSLFVTSSGEYKCKVVNPSSNCPLDTTWYILKIDCGDLDVGVEERNRQLSWTVFPNPGTETITFKTANSILGDRVEIYNAIGHQIKVMNSSSEMTYSIADLPSGLYFIQLKSNKQAPLKFIKQ